MVILGLLLIVLGALAIVSAVFTAEVENGQLQYLGTDVSALALFLIGVGAALAVVWGFSVFKWGSKRSLARRREQKKMDELSAKLDDAEARRRMDVDRHEEEDRPTL